MPTTLNFSINIPTNGADRDVWGAEINAAFEAFDAALKQVKDSADAAVSTSGAAFTDTISGPRAEFTALVGALTGNASTASKLATARKIELTGAVRGEANFDGSAAITINVSIPTDSIPQSAVNNLGSALGAKMPKSGGDFSGDIKRSGRGAYLHHADGSLSSGRITVSSAAPSGGSNGDIWLQV